MSSHPALQQAVEIRQSYLSEIISALSYALDLTEGAVPGHAIRCCLLAMRIAERLGLDGQPLADLYYATLLKDVGCSSNAARMCQIVGGGDDRAVKAGAKLADWRRPLRPDLATVQMLWRNIQPGEGAWRKTTHLLHMARTQHSNNRELISLRCDRGAGIIRKIGLPEQVAYAVCHLDEHWDGGGYPQSLRGRNIPLVSRLMGLAQHLDAFCMAKGPQAAIDVMLERSGRWFDPELTRIARALHLDGTLWTLCRSTLDAPDAHQSVLGREPDLAYRTTTSPEIDTLCEAFAEIIDAKSPFTFRHSQNVAEAAVAIGAAMDMPPSQLQEIRRAALLHDIGKLGVPNSILDKPGKLTPEELAIVQLHPGLSRQILARVSAFSRIAVIAGNHHERLDGSGYPNRLLKADLNLESRLLAVADVYGALSEQRPYRRALAPSEIAAIMEKDVPRKLDADCYDALSLVLGVSGAARAIQPLEPAAIPMPAPACIAAASSPGLNQALNSQSLSQGVGS